MFKLDNLIFHFVYDNCKTLGATFGLGAFEGFVMYFGIVVLSFTSALNIKSDKK